MSLDIPAAHRYELAAITDRLIYGHETMFSRSDALRLNDLVPRAARGPAFLLNAGSTTSGSSSSGYAPGVGDVSLKDDQVTRTFGNAMAGTVRAGQWVYARRGRHIDIRQLMATELDDGREARLVFRRDGDPDCLKLLAPASVSLGIFSFTFARFVKWKLPVTDH